MFEAARVDGANHWTLFWRIAVPLCRPALIVSFVFELKASWSDLLKPLIFLAQRHFLAGITTEGPTPSR
ncbi:ABC transporter permease subunit [Amycolatopsis tolypomycina]|uniref:ABC transporter permease subunit n=1 Tax=Amycolatopsis tolypomycina TaxID=208445 RepID=UPI0033A50EA6